MMIKYIVVDFGKAIAAPKTGNWNITEKFLELIDTNKLDLEEFKSICKKHSELLSKKVLTLDEEVKMFIEFYKTVLDECGYEYDNRIIEDISYNRVYDNDRYVLYDNVVEELKRLSENYTLIMVSDNWPSILLYLKENKLDELFTKIYISSVYGIEKKDKELFDYVINDFNIKEGEAIYIDDNEKLLDIAYEKGFDVRLIDRENKYDTSKYKIINNFLERNII